MGPNVLAITIAATLIGIAVGGSLVGSVVVLTHNDPCTSPISCSLTHQPHPTIAFSHGVATVTPSLAYFNFSTLDSVNSTWENFGFRLISSSGVDVLPADAQWKVLNTSEHLIVATGSGSSIPSETWITGGSSEVRLGEILAVSALAVAIESWQNLELLVSSGVEPILAVPVA